MKISFLIEVKKINKFLVKKHDIETIIAFRNINKRCCAFDINHRENRLSSKFLPFESSQYNISYLMQLKN